MIPRQEKWGVVKWRKIAKEELEEFTFWEAHVRTGYWVFIPRRVRERVKLKPKDKVELAAWNDRKKRYDCWETVPAYGEHEVRQIRFPVKVIAKVGLWHGIPISIEVITPIKAVRFDTKMWKVGGAWWFVLVPKWAWDELKLKHEQVVDVSFFFKEKYWTVAGTAHKYIIRRFDVYMPAVIMTAMGITICDRFKLGIRKV